MRPSRNVILAAAALTAALLAGFELVLTYWLYTYIPWFFPFAAITDAGMTGPHDSVIGVEAELAIRRMRLRQPVRFRPAEGGVRIEGVVLDCSDDGRARGLELLRRDG